MLRKTLLVLAGVAVLSFVSLQAFVFIGFRWNPGTVNMEMQLGSSGGPLLDGSANWDECAIPALAQWNNFLPGTGVSFNAVRDSTRTPASGDNVNSVFFAPDVFGTPFGGQTLAIARTSFFVRDGIDEAAESDVVFNTAKAFNCYRGELRGLGSTPEATGTDLQRVAIHEFGHVLGLNHPDQDGQTVTAIMNSAVSDIDAIQTDDFNGVRTLYGVAVTGIPFPPRNETLVFYNALEGVYQNTLGRQQNNQGFVDAEGTAVWFPEWLRYALNGCSVQEAQNRVFLQIRGQGIQPVCGVVAAGTINFPPRNQSLDFLNALEALYRDELGRGVLLSFIDLEGRAVWVPEYLRYRVNGCDHTTASNNVFQQINGGGIPPVCG